MQPVADLRSDTLTRPDAAMRQAMAQAEVGDDVFGEDPTINRLEEEGAAVLGQPAALFLPSGTMANQVAIHVHCRPGDELICEERSHVFRYEGGSIARLSGTQVMTVSAESGFPTADALVGAIRGDDPHFPRTRIAVLENTHNMAGGRVLDLPGLQERVHALHGAGIQVHLDGARLANAAVATGTPLDEFGRAVDSLTLCLSKGLGAPVGSLLAGSREFIREARRTRKAFGGGMRQAGVLAAACLLALHDGPSRLAEDHRRARLLADAAAEHSGMHTDRAACQTNIVMVDVPSGRARHLVDHLASNRVLALALSDHRIRLVTHRDLTENHIEMCLEALRAWPIPE